jgi:hypothetical protein
MAFPAAEQRLVRQFTVFVGGGRRENPRCCYGYNQKLAGDFSPATHGALKAEDKPPEKQQDTERV